MLLRLSEGDIGPLLHDEAETPLAVGKVSEVAVGIEGEVRLAFLLELGKPLFVLADDPAGCGVFDLLVEGVDFLLGIETCLFYWLCISSSYHQSHHIM